MPGTRRGQPLAFQAQAEFLGVYGRDDVAAYPARVLGDKGQRRLEDRVGDRVDVARQPRIPEDRSTVAAVVRCQQADAVKAVAVRRLVPAYPYLLDLHATVLPRICRLLAPGSPGSRGSW